MASLIASASPMHGEETEAWTLDPRSSSTGTRFVKIHAKPTHLVVGFHDASVLHKISCGFEIAIWWKRGAIFFLALLGGWALSYSLRAINTLEIVSVGDCARFSKRSWFLAVQMNQQIQRKALPMKPYGGRGVRFQLSWSFSKKGVFHVVSIWSLQGPLFQTSTANWPHPAPFILFLAWSMSYPLWKSSI